MKCPSCKTNDECKKCQLANSAIVPFNYQSYF
jgi:hypothetical protein